MNKEREELIKTLRDWQNGTLTASQVHEWGENHFPYSGEPHDEVTNEVLQRLDILDMNLLIAEDAPMLLDVLANATTGAEADQMIDAYYKSNVNIEARKRQLASDPLYAPFCKN